MYIDHLPIHSQWDEWIQFCEEVASLIWNKGANWLIAIEGTNWECDVNTCGWGENLEGVRNTNITFDPPSSNFSNKFVWTPHTYPEEVNSNPAYSEAGWRSHWGM